MIRVQLIWKIQNNMEQEQPKKLGPFDLIKVITHTKDFQDEQDEFKSAYIPFLINRGVSFFADTLFYANEMNINSHLSKKQQFDYLFHSIPARKRFAKWPKKNAEDENLEMVKQFFGYNNDKAKSALNLLNETQLKTIKESFIVGGINKNDKS